MEDKDYLLLCKEGDKYAFEPIVRQYGGLVWSLALNTLSDKTAVADAVQEVFIKVYNNLDKFDFNFPFKAWIARITLNHCINLNHKKKLSTTQIEDAENVLPSHDGLPEQTLLDAERKRAVQKAVLALPEMYRVPILLFHQMDMKYEEISQVLDLPMTLVKNRLHRARKLLAKALSEYRRRPGAAKEEGTVWTVQKTGNT